jgi:hypothetical protein
VLYILFFFLDRIPSRVGFSFGSDVCWTSSLGLCDASVASFLELLVVAEDDDVEVDFEA